MDKGISREEALKILSEKMQGFEKVKQDCIKFADEHGLIFRFDEQRYVGKNVKYVGKNVKYVGKNVKYVGKNVKLDDDGLAYDNNYYETWMPGHWVSSSDFC